MSSTDFSSRINALKKIIKRLPAQLTYYGSALGAIVLAGGGQLPPGLEFVAGGIGANLLSNLVDEIARGEDVLDDEIRQRAEDAITQSDIANLLTKQDFLQGYARLIQRLDAQKAMSQDILDELRTGFRAAATAEQMEELKQLLLQLVQQSPPLSAVKTRIFISYARADDEPFVERLYHDLKDEFEVWWDRVSMPNRGLTFLQEIRDAIDHADRLLLVAGPRAFTSDYVCDEWLYAYETYKGINIALRLGDYPHLPEQLGGFDAPDFRSNDDYAERLATLKRQLAEPVAPVGEFHGVPALPPHFLNRPEALDALRNLVIADVDKPTLISAEKRTTAVEGMGGIGKSVMATAFAHDRKVRFAFPDGIVWLTVGNKPSMYEMYRAVGVALGDDLRNYPDETTARQNAQKALTDKKCLLILDDVWELPVGRAFRDLISGTPARLLITTRNLQINDVLNANDYRLKLIDESQAADYLRSWVGGDPDLETIAEKLGYLFLALKLAGARMKKDGLSGTDYLRTFDRVSRMKIDRQASDREDSLEASITLSVDAAFANAEDDKLLYHTFGIFPKDTPVPQQTVLQLWRYLRPDLDEFDLLETLNALVDLALVERNIDDRTITLHDLLHSYTCEKLGDRYMQTHQDFLDSYEVDEWHQLPQDEPYLWWHIAYHLFHADKHATLSELLVTFDYLQNKLNVTDPNTMIADCDYLPDDHPVQLVKSMLSMSSHALMNDPFQLISRLCGHLGLYEIMGLLIKQARMAKNRQPMLQLLSPSLQPAGGALLRILEGHTDPVLSVSVRGTYAVSASVDRTLKVWNWQTGELLHTLEGHTESIWSVSLGKDFMVSASRDKTLKIWNWQTGELLRTLEGHTSAILSLALDADFVVSTSDDCTLKVWNWQTDTLLRTLEGHTSAVWGVSLSGDFAVSASSDRTLKVWNWQTGELLRTLEGHTSYVRSVSLSGDFAVSASSDCTLKVWNWQTGELLRTLEGHTSTVWDASLSGDFAVSASRDKTLMVWNWQSSGQISTRKRHNGGVNGVSLEGDFAVSASNDHTLKVWNVSSGELVNTLEGHKDGVTSVSIGRQVAVSTSYDGTLKVWNLLPNGKDAFSLLRTLEGHTDSVISVSLSGEFAASTSSDHKVKVWNWQTGELLHTLEGHTSIVTSISLNGDYAVSASDDRTLKVWNWKNGKLLRTFKGYIVRSLSITANYALGASDDSTVKIWNWTTGELVSSIEGHLSYVRSVSLSGSYAVTASLDRTLKVWNWQTNELITTFYADASMLSVAINSDASTIVAGDAGGNVHFLRPNASLRRLMGLEEDEAGDNNGN